MAPVLFLIWSLRNSTQVQLKAGTYSRSYICTNISLSGNVQPQAKVPCKIKAQETLDSSLQVPSCKAPFAHHISSSSLDFFGV